MAKDKSHLTTSEIARAVGVHPNTVRLYEKWGYLPPVPRSPNGYRRFSQAHLDQMHLARLAMHGPWPGRKLRASALTLVRQAASGDLGGALEQGYHHLALVQAEQAQAEVAADLLERWAQGMSTDATARPLLIGQAAKRLGVTADMLRNWERNGLIQVPRDPDNGYRRYSAAELGRLRVIRMLNRAGYSQMAILRMMLTLDQAQVSPLRRAGKLQPEGTLNPEGTLRSEGSLRLVLDTPRPDEDVYSAADRWLSTLSEQEQRAQAIIMQLEGMLQRQKK